MSLNAAVGQAITALRELARMADAEVTGNPTAHRRARALRDLAHRCAGQIQLHEDRA